MRYVMRQKLFAFGDDFVIQDAEGREAFYVDGRVLALGDKLVFEHPRGHEVGRVEQKLLSIGPTWVVSRDGREIATVKKSLFTFLHAKFSIDVPGPDDLEARGSFLEHEYTFTRGGRAVAEVSKRWLAITDSYGVDVAEGEDDLLILACTVIVDMACHPDEDKKKRD